MADEPEKNEAEDSAAENKSESEPFTEENDVQIDTTILGNCCLFINGDPISGDPDSPNKVHMTLKREGDVIVTVDGEDFMHEETGE